MDIRMVTEHRAELTRTDLASNPMTCVGCLAFHVGRTLCAELRADDACQKKIAARSLDDGTQMIVVEK